MPCQYKGGGCITQITQNYIQKQLERACIIETDLTLNPKATTALRNAIHDTRVLYNGANLPEVRIDFAIYLKALVSFAKEHGLEKLLIKSDADIDLDSIVSQIPDRTPKALKR